MPALRVRLPVLLTAERPGAVRQLGRLTPPLRDLLGRVVFALPRRLETTSAAGHPCAALALELASHTRGGDQLLFGLARRGPARVDGEHLGVARLQRPSEPLDGAARLLLHGSE